VNNVASPVSVAEGYQRWAASYDRDPNPLLAREERHLSPLLTNLRDKLVLDLACGTGRWLARLLAEDGPSGVGIDCSEAMLGVAGQKPALFGRLTRANCESLPFRSAMFDIVICSFAMGHIRDLRSTACELARITKPKADVLISDLHPEAYASGWRVGFRDQSIAIEIEMLPRAADEIVELVCGNGFECLAEDCLCLGDAEQPIFARAGREHSFVGACQLPAIIFFHFRRSGSSLPSVRA
jgi:ubiquinone/menaquinone biosynthesis C-methylase UbiE